MSDTPWPLLDDAEGAAVPPGLRVCDAHVHLFPPRVHEALRRWFARHAWPVRYPLDAEGVIAFLRARGVRRAVGLCYSHAPGMAEELNAFMAALAARHTDLLVPLGTVLPGEPGAEGVVGRAFAEHGLRGLKLHCHVQGVAADDPRLDPIYALAARAGRPIVIHAGPAPACAGYPCDPAALCRPEAVGRALARHPELTLVVPHLGADRYEAFEALLAEHPRLYLDTTMVLAGYLEPAPDLGLLARWPTRILFGTDFPNLPYAWDRELSRVLSLGLAPEVQDALLWGNAERLFGAPAST